MIDKHCEATVLRGRKIMLLAEYYSSGGTRTYLRQLLAFYAESGVELVLVGLEQQPDKEVASLLSQYGFAYVCYRTILGKKFRYEIKPHVWTPTFIWKERRAFRRYLSKEKFDGIIVSAGTPGQFAGAAGAVKSGVYILHTYPHGRRQRYFGRWVMNWAFKSVPNVVAVSEFQKSEMTRLWCLTGQPDKTIVIRNTAGSLVEARIQSDRSPLVVATASWVEPYKEPLEWLEIALLVSEAMRPNDVRFVWFGEGSLLSVCRNKAMAMSEVVDAEFRGHQEDLTDAYERADVYLQTSSVENMSLSVIEALRFGLPAVCTNVGGVPEIQVNGETGLLVPAHDTHAAADAVVSLLTNMDVRADMGSAATVRYQEEFSKEAWDTHMLQLHARVFKHKQGENASVSDP